MELPIQNPNLPADKQDIDDIPTEQESLTLDALKAMKPNEIFDFGYTEIQHPWKYNVIVKVKWVAVRGGIHDWAIYHSFDNNIVEMTGEEAHIIATEETIANYGAKLHDMGIVKSLVPCTPEALEMYRH